MDFRTILLVPDCSSTYHIAIRHMHFIRERLLHICFSLYFSSIFSFVFLDLCSGLLFLKRYIHG